MKSQFILITLLVFGLNDSYSQDKNYLPEVNKQVWVNFTKAFETSNSALFERLHSDYLIRVSGDYNVIKNKPLYIGGYAEQWKRDSIPRSISFRFIERVNDGVRGSERGIYKLTRYVDKNNPVHYYGKFHVILVKEDNCWRILVDYDSTENKTINEASYKAAYAMDDLDVF